MISTSTSIGPVKLGFTGSIGARGPQGIFGFTGSIGSVGAQGPQGVQGLPGIAGFTGSVGALGPQGLTGSIGYTGSIGIQGPQGPQGFTGSVGDIGFTGSVGALGPQGFIGSVGDQGPLGYTGSVGGQGYAGSQGDQGYTGSSGISLSGEASVVSLNLTNNINSSTSTLSYAGTDTNSLAVIMAVNDSSSPYVISTNNAANNWVFDKQGGLTVPAYNNSSKTVSGTTDIVYGDPYSSYVSTSTGQTTIYTASSEDIVALKMSLRIQYLGHIEMVEVSAVKPFDNSIVDYVTYGNVKSDSTATDTIITVTLDLNNVMHVQAQPPFDAYFTYTVVEYNKTNDLTVRV